MATNKPGNVRLVILFVLLAAAIGALFYDYKIARVAVESAYADVEKMNDSLNSSSERRPTTSSDIQKTLNRKPSTIVRHSPFTVETYHFASGVPFRSHKYFAVYLDGLGKSDGELVFVKQFKFELPDDELELPSGAMTGDDEEISELIPKDARREWDGKQGLTKSDRPALENDAKDESKKVASEKKESEEEPAVQKEEPGGPEGGSALPKEPAASDGEKKADAKATDATEPKSEEKPN